MDLTSTQAELLISLRSAADRGRTGCFVYCTEYLGYLPFGLYHWIEINGQAIEASALPPGYTRRDLDALESAGLLGMVGQLANAEDELESRTTYELRIC